ncbi:MAG: CHAT domain-containing protein [Cyclobacteriaceae bacterium]|nr:CHAT domain-containing protein [Cyclobacteriaceae bacterium]
MKKLKLILLLTLLGFSIASWGQSVLEQAQTQLDNGDENKALELLEKGKQKETPYYLNLVGEIWLKKGNGEKALDYFKKAQRLEEKEENTDPRLLGKTYNNIALALWSMGKNTQALQYHQVALQNREKLNDPLAEAASLNNIGIVYTSTQPDLAITYFEKAKEIYEKEKLEDKMATSYVNIGLAYKFREDYNEALSNLNKALDLRVKLNGKNSTAVAFVYSSLASVFYATEDFRFCIDYANKALKIYKSNYGHKHPEIATTYNLLGGAHFAEAKMLGQKDKYQEAIQSYQHAIIANITNFSPVGVYKLPPTKGYLNADIYLVSILQKALVYEAYHTQYSLKIADLEQSYNLLALADEIIDKIRQFRTNEADKIALGNISSEVYEAAIRVSLQMAEVKWKRKPYKEKAFYFADKSKSAVLLEAIADANAQSFAGIPNNLLLKEKEIKSEIAYLEQKLAQTANTDARKPLTSKLLEWNQTYNNFKQKLETDFPNYFALKYDIKTPTLQEIQSNLTEGAAIISYFVGYKNNRLYVFIITGTSLKVLDIALTDDFEKNVTGYRNAIYYKMDKTAKSVGYKLYQQLGLAKIPNGIKKLIIIPAGRISTIPLEALVINEENPTSYLIQQYDISYLYAASLMQKRADKKPSGSVALFAPVDFSGLGMSYLPGTKQEVEEISQLFANNNTQTELFIEANASKAAVSLKKVAESNIIHFATHGIVDEVRPERSQICLTTKDGSEGRLFTGDIYNLTFSADLVVLSACETGLGKLSKGEGIIGLTRAIIYSGANNIVVSLWSVADASTSQLMIDFYANMLKGQAYSKALANAKRQMINDPSYSKPYYWAPFVLIGN